LTERRDEGRQGVTDRRGGPESLGPTVRSPRFGDQTLDLPVASESKPPRSGPAPRPRRGDVLADGRAGLPDLPGRGARPLLLL